MEMDNLENRQIPGITGKLLWSLIAGWTTLLVTILLTYGSIKSEFQDKDKTDAIQDLRLKTIENAQDIQSLQIKSINEQVNENRSNISMLKAETNK